MQTKGHILRVFATISSMDPLVVDMYTDGVARHAAAPASDRSLKQECRHFTTEHSRNKFRCKSSMAARCAPSRLRWLFEHFSQEMGFDVSPSLWRQIADRVLRIALIGRERHHAFRERTLASNSLSRATKDGILRAGGGQAVQIVGLDIIFRQDGELMLFDVNASPSLYPHSGIAHHDHAKFLESHLRCAGLLPPSTDSMAHSPKYTKHVRQAIAHFDEIRRAQMKDGFKEFTHSDVARLADIARSHDEPLHDGHLRIYPSLDEQFSTFSTLAWRWPVRLIPNPTGYSVLDDSTAWQFLCFYDEHHRWSNGTILAKARHWCRR